MGAKTKASDSIQQRVQTAMQKRYSEDDRQKLINDTTDLGNAIADKLNSGYKDRSALAQLQNDIYKYQNSIRMFNAMGYDTSSYQQHLKKIEQSKDSQSRFYSQFKDENSYFDWTMRGKYSGKKVADIDNIIGYRQII